MKADIREREIAARREAGPTPAIGIDNVGPLVPVNAPPRDYRHHGKLSFSSKFQ
jgi:hypothetical protein